MGISDADRAADRCVHPGLLRGGLQRAAAVYGAPVMAAARRFNTYHYEYMGPPMLPPQELEAMGTQAQERVGAVLARLMEKWQESGSGDQG